MILTKSAKLLLEKRYLLRENGELKETPEELFRRVAKHLASAEKFYGKTDSEIKRIEDDFYEILINLDFLPNSPTLLNAGTAKGQLSACFVLPIEDSLMSITNTLSACVEIHKSAGGVGLSFSKIRPQNDFVGSRLSSASGPISFIKGFAGFLNAVKQGGVRGGANMALLNVEHPDIKEFITCKDGAGIENYNISVGITDEFMNAVNNGGNYKMRNPRTNATQETNANEIFDMIAKSAWKTGEPGVLFTDTINKHNPTPSLGRMECTNPCGELPLLPYESCNLGSINLSHMVKEENGNVSHISRINWDRLRKTIRTAIRFLDNVIDVNRYSKNIKEIKEMVKGNRKIGMGVMGFADMLIKLGVEYNSKKALIVAEDVMKFIQDEAKRSSEELVNEKTIFPNYFKSIYRGYRKQRNATVTTIAPTGSISKIAGCSSGIEPLFSVGYEAIMGDGTRLKVVNQTFINMAKKEGFYSENLIKDIIEKGIKNANVPEKYRKLFVTAHDVSPEWHIRMQAAFQKHVDNSISKTINMPHEATLEDVKEAYLLAYRLGCKGVTIYRDGSRGEGAITTKKEQEIKCIGCEK